MTQVQLEGVQILGVVTSEFEEILTSEALQFIVMLQRQFNLQRLELLQQRVVTEKKLQSGWTPTFLEETAPIRSGDWKVAPIPADLQKRWVEITGPTDRKMVINALNSGANIFMTDFEDSNVPKWDNMIQGQLNLRDAIRRTLILKTSEKTYQLNDTVATLLVRARGWHMDEANVTVDGVPMSASLFDFGLYFFHNVHALLERGTAPYFYLPKMESYLEARLWNEIFNTAQDALNIPRGTIKATVLCEHILLSFQLDEVLYELRDHIAGINAGRWDYIFSAIKKFRTQMITALPDRSQITMTVPFMRAYTELLVKTCHKRGAHAIGGMAAFIPNRRDAEVNAMALERVRSDKEREANDGFDGTWVAHPDLVPTAMEVFTHKLGTNEHQKHRLREEVSISETQLIDFGIPNSTITEAGIRNNISVALQYTESWLRGTGAVAIFNLMEDAATAEISRSQLWQWVHKHTKLDDGRAMTVAFYSQLADEEQAKLSHLNAETLKISRELLDNLVLNPEYAEFLTLAAYSRLES
jgi:malate synthase